jgi:aldose 1-epimerase
VDADADTGTGSGGGSAFVSLRLVSPDGDQGFPGELTVDLTYTLTDTDELCIEYKAT